MEIAVSKEEKLSDAISKLSDSIDALFNKVGQEHLEHPLTDEERLTHKKTIDKIYNKLLSLLEININSNKESNIKYHYHKDWLIKDCTQNYCNLIIQGRDSGIEKVSLQDLDYALDYHLEVICCKSTNICCKSTNRWNELEEILINNNFKYFYEYSNNLGSRIESFEKKFQEKTEFERSDLGYVVRYIEKFNFNWPEIEKHLLVSGEICLEYMEATEKTTRWIEAEPAILKSGLDNCSLYLKRIKEFFRWKQYENKIKNRPNRLVDYAEMIVKGRLPEELHNRMLMRSIKGNCQHTTYYFDFLKKREHEIVSYLKSISETERQEIISKV